MGMKSALVVGAFLATAAEAARPASLDPDTRAWWAITSQLSDDSMEGRDTGSAGYDRAAKLVAAKFAAARLKPAGENSGWFQSVPMHEISVTKASLGVGGRPLIFLHELTLAPAIGMPARVN